MLHLPYPTVTTDLRRNLEIPILLSFQFFLCHMISLKFLLGISWGGFDSVSFADFLVKFNHNSFSILFSLGCNFTFVLDTKTII